VGRVGARHDRDGQRPAVVAELVLEDVLEPGQRTGRRATYRVTGTGTPTGPAAVSARSPVGRALLGRRAGETVEAVLPGDRAERLRIAAVARAAGPMR
jgi:hypothetical protein